MTSKDTDELMHLLQDTRTTAQLQTYTNTLTEQTILQTFPEYLNSKMTEQKISPAKTNRSRTDSAELRLPDSKRLSKTFQRQSSGALPCAWS